MITKEELEEKVKNGEDLSGIDLQNANLKGANLRGADLRGADLRLAYLTGADLRVANLQGADLIGANLYGANLQGANLKEANLKVADLREADLMKTNLSGAKGLLDPYKWMEDNFESTNEGYIVYKAIGNTYFEIPKYWKIEAGKCLEENVDTSRTNDCGCGINFATRTWIDRTFSSKYTIWKCLLKFKYLATLVVPYHTEGKARCGKLKLLKIV